jgi:DNA mismatch endonuclease (patch repair protein)
MAVRSTLHALGFRYRLHRKDLPGTPDLVFPSRNKVIFVHGCFWHGHHCRMGQAASKTNVDFWADKIRKNVARDRRNISALRRQGWGVAVVWECELKKRMGGKWVARIARFLKS